MWKKIEFAIVLLLLAVLIMMSNHLEEMVSSGRVTGRNPCIVLDSGHGGEDPGKIGVNQAKANDTYYLLKRTEVPTIIVECGFLSNPEEAAKLVSPKYQEKLAEAIAEGILACMEN